jgi:hypothetical protein
MMQLNATHSQVCSLFTTYEICRRLGSCTSIKQNQHLTNQQMKEIVMG